MYREDMPVLAFFCKMQYNISYPINIAADRRKEPL